MGDVIQPDVSLSMLGRVLMAPENQLTAGRLIIPEGLPGYQWLTDQLSVRAHPKIHPDRYISIDGLNTLTHGQKLPLFSGAGLPANEWPRNRLPGSRIR